MSIRFECLSCGRMFEIGIRGFEHTCDHGLVEEQYGPLFTTVVNEQLLKMEDFEAEREASRVAFHEAAWLTEHVARAK